MAAASTATAAAAGAARSLQTLVSTDWLAANRDRVVLLDGSWHMPNVNRNALAEFNKQRIDGARFFDIDGVSDKSSHLPHMLPPPAQFTKQVGDLGISNDDHVVIYDSTGTRSACRVYWTFRVFDHKKVSVLDGGLVKWLAEGRPVVSSEPGPVEPKTYSWRSNPTIVKTYADIIDAYTTHSCQIVDARPSGRFHGTDPEPRAGLSSGHMPTAINLPFTKVLDPVTQTMLPRNELIKLFHDTGVNLNRPIINTCGSGITASVLFVAQEIAGATDQIAVFDGSWTEYASTPGCLIEKS
ncbi:Rhodanese-like domain-containing protein [Entophlyctis helioformis]|nr:Rhodanese-like domain-containing protein [Entophlyctis helioformis]